MKRVKIFDCEREDELEEKINSFLEKNDALEIKYQISHFFDGRDQIYSFSAMILYNQD